MNESGLHIVGTGVTDRPRTKVDQTTGEATASCNIAYMGGSLWFRFRDLSQVQLLKGGEAVTVRCNAGTGKDRSLYAMSGIITHINGKGVS